MLDPRMQIFYLTDRCDNACAFCICKRHLREGVGDSPETIQAKLETLPEGGMIDIYGGEPTLSESFFEILRQAKRRHCWINIASNARSFSHAGFFAEFRNQTHDYRSQMFIRSSLHGHTAALHDRHTGKENSFRQAVTGLMRLKRAGYGVSVNTVVTRYNYDYLAQIHRLAARCQVDIFKLSFMRYARQNLPLVVPLAALRATFPEVLKRVATSSTKLDLDSIPYCLAPAELALYAKDEQTIIESAQRLVKPEVCDSCCLTGMCPGLDREYFELFGANELLPVSCSSLDKPHATALCAS